MSLPSILDYLSDVEVVKIAAEQAEKKERRSITLSPEVLRAGLLGAAVTAAGTGLGYGAGKLVGMGADALSKRLTGASFPTQYVPPAFAALGALAGAAEAARMKRYKELLQHAADNPDRRASRSTSRK